MPHPAFGLVLASLAIAALACREPGPAATNAAGEVAVLPVRPTAPVRAPAPRPVEPERWTFVRAQATLPFAFMREGGVLALTLLQSAEIELSGSTLTLRVNGRELSHYLLTADDERVRVVADEPAPQWLAGHLTPESTGRRELATAWASFSLERKMPGDARSTLCASASARPPTELVLIHRRTTCDSGERALSSDGREISGPQP